MKKRIAALLSMLLVLTLLCPAATAFAAQDASAALRFRADGTFKIMLFADAHDDDVMEPTTTALMEEALDRCRPDLVIYLGDNTCVRGYDKQVQAIDALTRPVRDRGIPFAMVFGNHDDEFGMTREEIFEIYQSFGCLTYDADPALHGVGNCSLPVLASGSDTPAFNLWLIDSGSNNEDEGASGYDYVHEDQLNWYKATAAALAEQNGGKTVPAMVFQHIVIPEIYDALYVKMPRPIEKLTQERLGTIYSIAPVMTRLNGYWLEQCCPPDVYDGELAAWKEVGDVIAEFHGHDHKNSYEVDVDGIDIINVPTCGEAAYHSDINRGVGLITLHEDDPANYDYELIRLYDLALQKDSQICSIEGTESKAHYFGLKVADTIVMFLFRLCRLYYRIFPKIL
ncbi:MAG: metallophosphoesterase family protein [Clostridia bacterium]|nr:metallophosphoesterase family protein [Clostridia bacterium]